MDYVKAFLVPFLSDKMVWLSLAGWLLKLLNAKLNLGLSDQTITDLSAAVSTYAVVHVTHTNTVAKGA